MDEQNTIVPHEAEGLISAEGIARGTNFGRYVILEPIGKGGIGAVYAAYDSGLERKVAIKVLRPDTLGEGALARQSRLLREAQAMARLSNPNVNVVHDVGLYRGQVFVAMEFVDGWTIRQWHQDQHPSWREVLSVFLQAGQGLLAAHEAGLVHRDIKPDNILIGKDERVRVTDFGLASALTDTDGSDRIAQDESMKREQPDTLASSLTQTGAVLGSPAYMAPEQHRGEPANAKSDQFGFCVTLYEILYGQRPFQGKNQAEIADNVIQSRIHAAPSESKVPGWLRGVLLRGLSSAPEDRYPSMKALLAELVRDPAKTRRRWLAWGGMALLSAVAVWGGMQAAGIDQSSVCQGADRHLVGVWDPQVKQRARAAFVSTQKPNAAEVWTQFEQVVNRYTREWTAQNQSACQATHLHGEQSPALLDLRMRCLNRRLLELKALAQILLKADEQVVNRAVQAGYKLTPVDSCADIEALTAPVPLPTQPGLLDAVKKLETELAKTKALGDAGKYKEALGLAGKAVQKAKGVAHRPIQAEALYQLAILQDENGEAQKAEETLKQAIWRAEAGRHNKVAAQAWNKLVYVVGHKLARYEEGHMWRQFAAAAVERFDDRALEAELFNHQGLLLHAQGKYQEALGFYQRSLALRKQVLGLDHPDVARSINTLGAVFNRLGRYDESALQYRRALAIWEKAYGRQHQISASALNNLGHVLHKQGRNQEAIGHLRRALKIWEQTFGPEHPNISHALNNLGIAYHGLRQYEQALIQHKRALAIKQRAYGPRHPRVATSLLNLAETYRDLEQHELALRHFKQAATIRKEAFGAEHHHVGLVYQGICETLRRKRRYRDALNECQRSLRLLEKTLGPNHVDLATTLYTMGIIHLDRGAAHRAVPPLERALALQDTTNLSPLELAATRFVLARSLWEAGLDQDRALRLAKLAYQTYQDIPEGSPQALAVSNWLSKRQPPPHPQNAD